MLGLIAYIIGIGIFIAGAFSMNSCSCNSKAQMMGFKSSWGPINGCMVEYKPNKWININSYRAVDE